MDVSDDAETMTLLQQAGDGDVSSLNTLFQRNRKRLKQMVSVYWDSRLATRIDESDVVQEALAAAAQRIAKYVEERPIPFYPWLRQIAWERLMQLRQTHLGVQKRSVSREQSIDANVSNESVLQLANRFATAESSPSQKVARAEMHASVRAALDQLSPDDREVLVLRYLEQLSTSEAAIVLGISPDAVSKRHMRAIKRLRDKIAD